MSIFIIISTVVAWARERSEDERGAAAVEYGLLVALIAAAIVGTVALIGPRLNGAFDLILDNLPLLSAD